MLMTEGQDVVPGIAAGGEIAVEPRDAVERVAAELAERVAEPPLAPDWLAVASA
jgi:hypothetical protein